MMTNKCLPLSFSLGLFLPSSGLSQRRGRSGRSARVLLECSEALTVNNPTREDSEVSVPGSYPLESPADQAHGQRRAASGQSEVQWYVLLITLTPLFSLGCQALWLSSSALISATRPNTRGPPDAQVRTATHVTCTAAKPHRPVIGPHHNPPIFRSLPYAHRIYGFWPRPDLSLPIQRPINPPRHESQVRPPRPLDNSGSFFLYSPLLFFDEERKHKREHRAPALTASPRLLRSPSLKPHPPHRNVVQAHRKGPALRHCGRCCPRVHHPPAQEGMSSNFTISRERTNPTTDRGNRGGGLAAVHHAIIHIMGRQKHDANTRRNRCTVSPSRRGLPAPSRRSRLSPPRPWYDDYVLPRSIYPRNPDLERLCRGLT